MRHPATSDPQPPRIAYFSMEVGLQADIPTYSGGLGILAGDTLRAAADMGLPMVGITLLHRQGYFHQDLDESGRQSESPESWSPEARLEAVPERAVVSIEGRTVQVGAWLYPIYGVDGHVVPVYLLDTRLSVNAPVDRELTDRLYGGDARYRLAQEIVLGMGGVGLLKQLGGSRIGVYHMNEGHSALLSLALLEERLNTEAPDSDISTSLEAVRRRCVFTTHTPVPAGHDQFSRGLVDRVLGREHGSRLEKIGAVDRGTLNMTALALTGSWYVNGVSSRHESVSQSMFPHYPINSITNGVHAVTWTSPPFKRLFDRFMDEWRRDSLYLRYAVSLPLDAVRDAHSEAKASLLSRVSEQTGVELDPAVFTIGFARRAAAYKRADLIFADMERLRSIARAHSFQILFAGKAHPRDEEGKALIRRIHSAAAELGAELPVLYLPRYDMDSALALCSGVDLWLNTPQRPKEASGTSGMKAALNGVPSFSVLDGWWVEGHVEGETGWSIMKREDPEPDSALEAENLYRKLESVILPTFYDSPRRYLEMRRSAIALNGSFFSAQRMMFQYLKNAYQPTLRNGRD